MFSVASRMAWYHMRYVSWVLPPGRHSPMRSLLKSFETLFLPPGSFSLMLSPLTEICTLTSWSPWWVQSWSKASFLASQCLTQSAQTLQTVLISLAIAITLHTYCPYLKLSSTKHVSSYSDSLSSQEIEWTQTGSQISHKSHLAQLPRGVWPHSTTFWVRSPLSWLLSAFLFSNRITHCFTSFRFQFFILVALLLLWQSRCCWGGIYSNYLSVHLSWGGKAKTGGLGSIWLQHIYNKKTE